jgi:3-methylcrotonyl-CoA carboxylase alpha subunit
VFSKVLVANRGEIAVRIMQTCRELGIETVAVYSDVDRAALHVRVADAAFAIGAAPARQSYLNGSEVIKVAVESGAEAIHPGYGFLAENADFAAAVVASGLTWVGPPARVIALLGDKVAAKDAAIRAGVPVVPGYAGEDISYERLRDEAERIGYPVMLKAAAGGGGKGMRIVENSADLHDSIDAARREAGAAFGDDRVFMERLLIRPRHVEMQILADGLGGIVYLGERDCSLQRRHQKVVEEAPSPALSDALRAEMGEAAARIARVSGYANAGTVEFLLAGESYYFLEVNTRIQVEHAVTEAITGMDLVRLQLQIAADQPLGFTQSDIELRGHAFEARIYAEDPDRDFLPSTGSVQAFAPPQGPGIRNDVGVEVGDSITMYYDPMIAKLIVQAETRPLALARLRQALDRYACDGPTTNLPFLKWITRRPEIIAGEFDIGFIEREWHPAEKQPPPPEVFIAAALVDASTIPTMNDPWRGRSEWRMSGIPRRFQFESNDELYELALTSLGNGLWHVTAMGSDAQVSLVDVRPNSIVLKFGQSTSSFNVSVRLNGYSIGYEGTVYGVTRPWPVESDQMSATRYAFDSNLSAPMPGTIVSINVTEGQSVDEGEALVVMEAMKMEHVVEAVTGGTVKAILVHAGELVAAGTVLVQMQA